MDRASIRQDTLRQGVSRRVTSRHVASQKHGYSIYLFLSCHQAWRAGDHQADRLPATKGSLHLGPFLFLLFYRNRSPPPTPLIQYKIRHRDPPGLRCKRCAASLIPFGPASKPGVGQGRGQLRTIRRVGHNQSQHGTYHSLISFVGGSFPTQNVFSGTILRQLELMYHWLEGGGAKSNCLFQVPGDSISTSPHEQDHGHETLPGSTVVRVGLAFVSFKIARYRRHHMPYTDDIVGVRPICPWLLMSWTYLHLVFALAPPA
ncbi:hypothetical protein F5Y07DRAFT_347275 [Xylaria sp. FL0933]|nr:hypothetical protein F5Y07DRAFT_347275 [Xylaria sp. FL0933]